MSVQSLMKCVWRLQKPPAGPQGRPQPRHYPGTDGLGLSGVARGRQGPPDRLQARRL